MDTELDATTLHKTTPVSFSNALWQNCATNAEGALTTDLDALWRTKGGISGIGVDAIGSFNTLDFTVTNKLVVDNFRDFFRRNLVQYGHTDLPVGFVGSVAFHYEAQLKEAAVSEGYTIGRILKSPIDGLVTYHNKS